MAWRAHMIGVILTCATLTAAVAAEKQTNAVLPGGNSKKPINIEAVKLDLLKDPFAGTNNAVSEDERPGVVEAVAKKGFALD